MHYPGHVTYQGYGQIPTTALRPELARALKPLAPSEGLPTIAYVGLGVAAVGAVWFFFLRKKAA